MQKLIFPILFVAAMLGQVPPAASHNHSAPAKSGVDLVIELVQGGASESTVIKALRSEGTVYKLSIDELLKLQKAGVSENIINAMTDPKARVVAAVGTPNMTAALPETAAAKDPSPAGAGPAAVPPFASIAVAPLSMSAAATPYPPDLPDVLATRKRRLLVASFGYGAVKDAAQVCPQLPAYWLALYGQCPGARNTDDIGLGIRAMLISRLHKSNVITVLDRSNLSEEQARGVSAELDRGTGARMGHILGADCILSGDITIFGRDDKDKSTGGGGGGGGVLGGVIGGLKIHRNEVKAVVGLDFRIADAETSEVIFGDNAKGQASRKSKGVSTGGLAIGGGGAAGGIGSSGTSNSNFSKTLDGEATANAVDKIVQELEARVSELPVKPRKIEGRAASITPKGVYLALGNNDGVLRGDRFEILQINNDVIDPQTGDVIDVEAAKVGELVVAEVHEKTAIGAYGGQPLSLEQLKGKGYEARLMSK